MKNKDTGERIASCSECPSTFKLVVPADRRYTEPREKPTGKDYIRRVYECEDERHRNTIYWVEKDPIAYGTASIKLPPNLQPLDL